MNLVDAFLARASSCAGRVAIIDGRGRSIRYGELAARSAALAGAWRAAGLRRGDRVLLAMGVGIELYVSLAALWRLGAVAVFPEPALGLGGLRHAVAATRPRAFLGAGWYRLLPILVPGLRATELRLTPADRGGAPVEGAEAVGTDHPALISFTSGTSGAPKAIVRSHGFLKAQNDAVAGLLTPSATGEVDLVAFPVFVVVELGLGVTSVLPNWRLSRQDRADPAAIAAHMRRFGVTRALLPPSICERLVGLADVPPLQAVFTGGGPVFPDLMERLTQRWPQAEIVAVYGSTEAEPIAHLHARDIGAEDWQAMRSGRGLLAGRPIAEIALRLDDDEIVVTGDHVNKGYLDPADDPANKIRHGDRIWHRTGDAGRLDGDGRLWLLGRHGAKAGGFYPFEVEAAARGWPGVRRAALVQCTDTTTLAIEGDRSHAAIWQQRAAAIGAIRVAPVAEIPLDRRHRSKVDLAALRTLLQERR